MIWKCKCGATKTSQPYRSSIVKEMLCDVCAGDARHPAKLRQKSNRPGLPKGWTRGILIQTRRVKV